MTRSRFPEFRKELMGAMERLRIPRELAALRQRRVLRRREEAKVEILQMALLKPRIAVLADSVSTSTRFKIVAAGVRELVGPAMGALVITHYQRINYIEPDFVRVFVGGRIVAEGGPELAHTLEAEGYEAFMPEKVLGADGSSHRVETQVVAEIGSDYKYGFHTPDDAEDYFFKSGRGLSPGSSSPRSPSTRTRAGLDAQVPAQVARVLPGAAAPDLGRRCPWHRLRQHLLLHPADREAGQVVEDLPPDIKDTWDQLGIPEAEKRYLAGVGAQYESEVVYHKLKEEDLEAQGVLFLDMDSGLRQHEELVKQYLRHDHPAERQQVRGAELRRLVGRLVHLRAAGSQGRDALRPTSRINAENMGQLSAR